MQRHFFKIKFVFFLYLRLSKSRDVTDESNTILTEWKLFETTVFWHSCKWNRCCFEIFWLGNENTRLYLAKTKQSSYYFNLFHESNLLSYLCWLTHPSLNVSTPTFYHAIVHLVLSIREHRRLFVTDLRDNNCLCFYQRKPTWKSKA
jgi:hypothetical protein